MGFFDFHCVAKYRNKRRGDPLVESGLAILSFILILNKTNVLNVLIRFKTSSEFPRSKIEKQA